VRVWDTRERVCEDLREFKKPWMQGRDSGRKEGAGNTTNTAGSPG
jgi:hypothetical protein